MIFRIKNKTTRRLRAYEAACSCAQPKKMTFLGVGNVDDGTAQPVNSVNDESKYWPNWRENNSSIRGVVGSSSSMTLSAKHLSNLKSDNPTLLQGHRNQGGWGLPPPRSVNPVSI